MDEVLALRLAGLLAMIGAAMYAVGDSLLLAAPRRPVPHPGLAAHAAQVGDMAKLADLEPRRIVVGGLLGVFGTPLVVLGWWQLHAGLRPAGDLAALGPLLLFAGASIIGGFVHGWFMALAEEVRLLATASEADAPRVLEALARARRVLAAAYAPVLVGALVASAWFALLVAGGSTAFPSWMAAANPVFLLAAFLVVRRILPARAARPLEGAGFSVAYLLFFGIATAVLWEGVA